MPARIQLRRSKGWRLPEGARSVARPSRYGNPFKVGIHGDHAAVVAKFRAWILHPDQAALLERTRRELAGRDLACFCGPGLPCHADVLLEVVNGDGGPAPPRQPRRVV
jgi:hypothetical protein